MIFGLNLASYLFQIPSLILNLTSQNRQGTDETQFLRAKPDRTKIATEVKSQLHVRADPGLTALVLEYSTIITTSDTIP